MDLPPVLTVSCPFFCDIHHCQIQHFHKVFNKPVFELQDRIVEGGETLLLIRRFYTGSSFDDCGNEKGFVNIDATTGLINNFHGQKLLSK